MPGDNLRFTNDEHTQVESCEYDERQAVADPFLHPSALKEPPSHGSYSWAFWAFVVPELISDLTHDFEVLSKSVVPSDHFDDTEDEYVRYEEEDACGGCD